MAFFFAVGAGLLRLPESSPPEQVEAKVPRLDHGSGKTAAQPRDFNFEQSGVRETDFTAINPSDYTEGELQNIRVYEKYNQAVVNITTKVMKYYWNWEPYPLDGGSGSGSIIDRRGYVLTNNHVIEDAYKVFITLHDGEEYEGEVVGADPENDLAVVKFDPGETELNTIPFGTSSDIRIGQKVIAIGNPFALNRTLTTGIISGLGRPIRTDSGYVMRNMIQTDASINPGNSGGPLLNSMGEMIGINTMIYSPSGGSVGIGFAVPIDTARRIVPDIIQYGTVKRGWLDIIPIAIDRDIYRYAERFYGKLPVSKGLLVSRVVEGGNADKAGIRGGDKDKAVRGNGIIIHFGGDIITEIDGEPVSSIADFYGALEDNRPGETVTITAYRGNSKRKFKIKLSNRPDQYQWD